MPGSPVLAHLTSIGFKTRTIPEELSAASAQFCFRVPLSLASHTRGALLRLMTRELWDEDTGLWADVEDAISRALASDGICCPDEGWGAEFNIENGGLQVRQGLGGLAPPWEFTSSEVAEGLEVYYRTEGSMGPWELVGLVPVGPAGAQGEPGADGADGQAGADGEDGGFYVITQRTPEGAPHVAIFERQLHNAGGDPVTPKQDFGGVIAPAGADGEDGEPGAPGAPGATGGTIYIYPPAEVYPQSDTRAWSYAAWRTVHDFAQSLLADPASRTADFIWGLISSGVRVSGRVPPEVIDAIDNLVVLELDEITNPVVLEEVAEWMYCQLITRPYLLDSDFYDIYQAAGGDWTVWTTSQPIAFMKAYISKAMTHGPEEARNVIRWHMEIARRVPGGADFSYLPCTPAVSDWQSVHDFITTEPGAEYSFPTGAWIDGEGIGFARDLDVVLNFGATYRLHVIEVVYSNVNKAGGENFHQFETNDITQALGVNSGTFLVRRWESVDGTDADFLRVKSAGTDNTTQPRLHRISLGGYGEVPPWATPP